MKQLDNREDNFKLALFHKKIVIIIDKEHGIKRRICK